MRKFILAAAALLALGLPAQAQWVSPTRTSLGLGVAATTQFYAENYSGAVSGAACTWDSTHDVGDCVNSAIAAAAANGGGTVVLPAGTLGFSTAIANTTSGVHIYGAGVGLPRDTQQPTNFLSITRLVWIGAAGVGPAFDLEPPVAATTGLYSVDLWGFTVDCASLVDECVRLSDIRSSFMLLGQAEARKTGVNWTTRTLGAGTGDNQHNDVWLDVRNLDSSYSATGVLIDKGAGTTSNTSITTFHRINALYRKGDGIVAGGSDNISFELVRATHIGTDTTGTGFRMANSAYVPPSGVAVNGFARGHTIFRSESAIQIDGLQTGATFVAAGGNTGSGALAPVTIATNATTTGGTSDLNFASTTGVVVGASVSCGGTTSGVYPNTVVNATTATTVTMRNLAIIDGGVSGVASGQSCTFTYGVTPSAVAGAYTLSYNGATFTLTAPAGGHTQAGIAVASGAIRFTDMVIPWTGTANNGDTWTITLPTPTTMTEIIYVDKGNAISTPHCEYGSSAAIPQGTSAPTLQTCDLTKDVMNGPVEIDYYMPNAAANVPVFILDNPLNGPAGSATQTVMDWRTNATVQARIRGTSAGAMFLSTNAGVITLGGTDVNTSGAVNVVTGLQNNGKLLVSPTAPTIASGGCTTGSAQSLSANNGSAAFEITLGGATCGSTITLTMPAASANWVCSGYQEAAITNYLVSTGAVSTTAVVLTNVVRTTGIAGNFTGATKYVVNCLAY